MRARRRSRGPEPKPRDERRTILVGVKVSPRELGAFRSAARSLPVATWIRSRALEALEASGPREQAEAFLGQAKALRDRANQVLEDLERQFRRRMSAADRLIARATEARWAARRAASGRAPGQGRRERARRQKRMRRRK